MAEPKSKNRAGRPPAKRPQSFAEMLEDGEKRRASSKIYRAESAEFVDSAISDLVSMSTIELARVADKREKIKLKDTHTIKELTILYMKSCAETSNTPTVLGLARSFGVSTQAFDLFKKRNPDHPTTEWLNLVHDEFARINYTAAQKNLTNPVVTIFGLKAMFQWKDVVTLEAAPPSDPLGGQKSPEEIAERYGYLEETLPETTKSAENS